MIEIEDALTYLSVLGQSEYRDGYIIWYYREGSGRGGDPQLWHAKCLTSGQHQGVANNLETYRKGYVLFWSETNPHNGRHPCGKCMLY